MALPVFAAVAIMPAIATPLLLWKMPTDFLPVLLADYLTAHFFVYGVVTLIALFVAKAFTKAERDETHPPPAYATMPDAGQMIRFGIGVLAVVTYALLILGSSIDQFVTSFAPVPVRVPIMAMIALGTIPYFLTDEWLTRRLSTMRGAYLATKLLFVVSLAIAVALNIEKLFFLIIIIPVILIFFVVFGLFSRWANQATHVYAVGALSNALIFAYAIAVTFPLVSR